MRLFIALLCASGLLCTAGCGSGGSASSSSSTLTTASAPTITTAAAQNNAVIVTLASSTSGATIYYTIDGTTPTSSSIPYESPFLVASDVTLNAITVASGYSNSSATSKTFSLGISSGTLVWSDEFSNSTSANAQPGSSVWAYDTGNGSSGWGNNELEYYCAYGSTTSPCSTSTPNEYVDTNGYLNIVAQQPSSGVYTSARMKTQGLFSFQYGRLEIKAKLPEEQGLWPAGWLLGTNYATVGWPSCGEQDVMERVGAAGSPDWNDGSIHGYGFTGSNLGTTYYFASGDSAASWHTYGMIWKKNSVAYYIDDETSPYVTYTPSNISSLSGAVWPFNSGPAFLILNLAVGGSWPGSPTSSTTFPATMQVDYVRIYAN